jgi:hypothetical protein
VGFYISHAEYLTGTKLAEEGLVVKISIHSPIEEGLMQPLALTEEGLMHAIPRILAIPHLVAVYKYAPHPALCFRT